VKTGALNPESYYASMGEFRIPNLANSKTNEMTKILAKEAEEKRLADLEEHQQKTALGIQGS
jgi:hypothetical protein